MKKRWISALLALTLLLGIACGCAAPAGGGEAELGVVLEDMGVPLAGLPPVGIVLNPSASGTAVQKNDYAEIDYSNAKDGYVMVKWKGSSSTKVKVLVWGPDCTSQSDAYHYFLRTDGDYDVLPLSDGNGKYKVTVWKHVGEPSKYSQVLSASLEVTLTDQFAPFLRPNQYVNYSEDSAIIPKAQEIIENAGAEDNLSKVGAIYEWVVTSLTYDYEKAKNVKTDYLPDVDKVMEEKKGICWDYASLMAAMLRSQGVPVKLVVGYTSRGEYHAWINVWSESDGWVEGMIYFNGQNWELMDPTFASSGKQSKRTMEYIGDGKNYKARFLY